ncbi:plasma membrane fusion protein prm1-like [Teratosphaeria destructans]|uniref:Plasma membrane fusion protein PRM1 n=1 Tax=Teratosphaeria destructans TaxID=418781 RepID=A0A9W7SKY5_9PEZI|nr:plasma membrane fusion protein prm1-like [Teratosphaeria destructans]
MASSENQQQNPNPAPPSLSAGDHEMRDYYATQEPPRPPSQREPYLTPYLGLRARLSQTWINRWTILLLLVLVRTLFAIASLDDNLGTARKQALSMCTSVENVGSVMASMPHYMADGVNELAAKGIEKAIDGLMEMLILTVTGVEEIVLFVIHLLTNTYLCLITFAVTGSLGVAISVAEDVGNALNSTVQAVGKDLGSAAADFAKDMDSFLSDIDKLLSTISGKDIKPPNITLTSEIATLDSLKIPTGYDTELQKLNGSIPTFSEVENFTDTVIEFPFEEIKKLLNESLPKYTMNRSLFPVPVKRQLTFCSDDDGISDFFDDLVHIERLAKKIFLAVLIVLAVLAMIPMAYRELRRYKFMTERSKLVRNDAIDPMDSVYLVSRPYTSTAGLKLAEPFKSTWRRTLVRWAVAYATTVPALFVLSLALAGLLGCLCQYVLLKAIEKEVPVLENEVIGFADKVINELNNASAQWAVGVNHIINDTNTKINTDVFGWVNTSTTAVNNTLNAFVNETMTVLNATFGGTPLYTPVLDVLDCLVLLKVRGIENGLTWVQDHAHIDFPTLPNDTFSLGTLAKVSGSEADILNTGSNGTTANAIADAVYHVTDALYRAIRQEAIISSCVLIIWFIIACIGLGRALFLFFKGGNQGPYVRPRVAPHSPAKESHELDDFGLPRVPTYEQATRHSIFGPVDLGDHRGNKFNGQAYTLTPAPLPTFEIQHARDGTSPVLNTGFQSPLPQQAAMQQEKLGYVPNQAVDAAIRRPTHIRASSHGDYGVTSPSSPLPPLTQNPFADNTVTRSNIEKRTARDPFADPVR